MTVMESVLSERVEAADWAAVARSLDDEGGALLPQLLTPAECAELAALYDSAGGFRATVDMAQHRFGSGSYKYFAAPLPEPVEQLRQALYPKLRPIAQDWYAKLGRDEVAAEWPESLDEWLDICHRAGQTKPTPLLLRYGPGDWNALHRDLYGDLVFPFQVAIGLDEPGVDYTGGEFVVVGQRPRAQSRATAVVIPRGHGLVFTTRDRPIRTKRGWANAPMRHGVS